jgi:hypothetical protein
MPMVWRRTAWLASFAAAVGLPIYMRNVRKFLVALLVLSASVAYAAQGVDADYGPTPEWSALHKLLFQKRSTDLANDPEWRLSLAGALHQYCESVMAQIPRNTPQEDQWVESESRDLGLLVGDDEKFIQRSDRLENSVEYARYQVRRILSVCSVHAQKLGRLERLASQAEALLWIRFSSTFNGHPFIWRSAEIVGLIPRNSCQARAASATKAPLPPDKYNICDWDFVRFGIIYDAVIPLLEKQ